MSKKLFEQALQEIMRVSEGMQGILKVRTRDRRDAESRLRSSFAQEYSVARERLGYLQKARGFRSDLSRSTEDQEWHTEHLLNWLIEEYGLNELSKDARSRSIEPGDVLDKLAEAKSTYPENPQVAEHHSNCREIASQLLATCSQPAIIIFTEVYGEGVVLNKLGQDKAYPMLRSCLYPLRKFVNKHQDLLFETRFTDSHITYIPLSDVRALPLLYEAFEAALMVVNESKQLYGNDPKLRRLKRVKPGIQIAMDVGEALVLQDSVRSEHVSKGLMLPSLMIKAGMLPHQFCISPKVMRLVRDDKRSDFVFRKYAGKYHGKTIEMFEVMRSTDTGQ
jgi:hypothetical protein